MGIIYDVRAFPSTQVERKALHELGKASRKESKDSVKADFLPCHHGTETSRDNGDSQTDLRKLGWACSCFASQSTVQGAALRAEGQSKTC